MTCFQRIQQLLEDRSAPYKHLYQASSTTTIRGDDITNRAKAVLIRLDATFRLFVLAGSHSIDSKKLKAMFAAGSIRFATAEELLVLTGLAPGALPPFGRPILDFDLYVDESVTGNDTITFNAGTLSDSFIMGTRDYLDVAHPIIGSFTVPAEGKDPNSLRMPPATLTETRGLHERRRKQ